jgi:hypothetical protein
MSLSLENENESQANDQALKKPLYTIIFINPHLLKTKLDYG